MELQIDRNEPFPVARVSGELGALDAGRPARDFRERLMMLQLTGQVTP